MQEISDFLIRAFMVLATIGLVLFVGGGLLQNEVAMDIGAPMTLISLLPLAIGLPASILAAFRSANR